jgi:hypothetical protein
VATHWPVVVAWHGCIDTSRNRHVVGCQLACMGPRGSINLCNREQEVGHARDEVGSGGGSNIIKRGDVGRGGGTRPFGGGGGII